MTSVSMCLLKETPPRAWGKPENGYFVTHSNGNTPTGVGKTVQVPPGMHLARKHPHGRGENFTHITVANLILETPPRAWGKHNHKSEAKQLFRNTPTGVGKTVLWHGAINR